jgi:cytochrome c oxidase subunit II
VTLRISVLAAVLAASLAAAGEPEPTRTIDVVASKYKFVPDPIEVTVGDLVELRLKSGDVEHGIGIKAFKVKALIPKGGEVVAVRFVATEAGTFDVTCSEYCGKGHKQMKAKLVVKEKEKEKEKAE